MEYIFEPTSCAPEKINAYADLLSSVFTGTKKFTVDFLNWQYCGNPTGKVVGFDAFYNNKLVAHYVTIPVLYSVDGIKTKGLLSLNTATHPEHQGKGLFTKLADKTYTLAKELGFEFVIGVANQNSTPGFLKKLNFILLSPLEVKIGLGNLDLENEKIKYRMSAVWDIDSIRWRLHNPSALYFRKNGGLYSSSGKPMISVLLSQEKHIEAQILPNKGVQLKVWIGLAEHLRKSGIYFSVPGSLKPSPLNLIFKPLTSKFPSVSKKDIYFSLLDFDAY
jgi:hypothetical protein